MQRFLNLCEEIEQTVAAVYRYWEDGFSEDIPLSTLWGKLADDELDHIRQVQLAKRVAMENVLSQNAVTIESLQKALAKAKNLLAEVKQRDISGVAALRAAIRIEEEFSKAHLLNATRVKDKSMQAMFESLARADEQHIATLRNYCESVLGKASD